MHCGESRGITGNHGECPAGNHGESRGITGNQSEVEDESESELLDELELLQLSDEATLRRLAFRGTYVCRGRPRPRPEGSAAAGPAELDAAC